MSLPEQTPKLPKWFFLISDALLVTVAAFIAAYSPRPLSVTAILTIAGCVALGAIVTAAALIADYVRKTEEAIDDRQRSLEALSRTTATSAEQISIAVNGLHEIAELAQKNLKQAEQLPQKLQEKIEGFTRQLEAVRTAETAALQQELTSLRTTAAAERTTLQQELAALRVAETEKFTAAGAGISRATAEFAKLEAATALHLTATTNALAALPNATSEALARQQEILLGARTAAEASLATALAHLEARFAELNRVLDEKLAVFNAAAERVAVAPVSTTEEVTAAPFSMTGGPAPLESEIPASVSAPEASAPVPAGEESATPQPPPAVEAEAKAPKKSRGPRKPKVEEPAGELSLAAPAAVAAISPTAETVSATDAPQVTDAESSPAVTTEPAPAVVAETSAPAETAAPVDESPAPAVAEPASSHTPVAEPAASPEPVVAPEPAPEPASAATEEPVRPNTPTGPAPVIVEPADEPSAPATTTDEFTQLSPDETAPIESITSDSTTRLLVTAYIGIGNRLFIRGDGPGLNWDKGVPLQFVSIGKWRWETDEAAAPVRAKLFKNDEIECSALGELKLTPGRQSEVTARF